MRLKNIKQPRDMSKHKPILNEMQRFLWWKKTFNMFYGIMITILIVPIIAYRRGIVNTGIKISIVFYFVLLLLGWYKKYTIDKKDKEFLTSKNIISPKPKWWMKSIGYLFLILKFYVIYLMIKVWMVL